MTGDSNRLGDAVALLMEAAERFQAIGIAPETMKRIDDFLATIHPAECVELPEETVRPEAGANDAEDAARWRLWIKSYRYSESGNRMFHEIDSAMNKDAT